LSHCDYNGTEEDTVKTADTYVRARIDSRTKERAAKTLAAMGLSISDAIRLLMLRVVDERRLPFEIKGAKCDDAQVDCRTGVGEWIALQQCGRADSGP
jgi:DNA-damage-inducible protein J